VADTINNDAALMSWLRMAIARAFAGAQPSDLTALKGDASGRRFWRVALTALPTAAAAPPATAIVVDLGPEDLPLYARALELVPTPLVEPPWLTLQRFFSAINVAVPQVYFADCATRRLLVEDVGELPLFDAAARGDAADLFRLAVDQLILIHGRGTAELPPDALPARIAYDERLFRWELEQFLEFGLSALRPGADKAALGAELDYLAARLGRLPRVLSHRDYHGHNLFVQFRSGEPRIRVIDFQDALMAPAAQDLAVLLTTRDTSRLLTPRIEQRVLDYYYGAQVRRQAATMSYDDFVESYRLCVLQHALKVIGRFLYLEGEGRRGYVQYIPYALGQARRILRERADFRALRAALGD
jgi:aminoglycoside/choline kinase family phosphotransferase